MDTAIIIYLLLCSSLPLLFNHYLAFSLLTINCLEKSLEPAVFRLQQDVLCITCPVFWLLLSFHFIQFHFSRCLYTCLPCCPWGLFNPRHTRLCVFGSCLPDFSNQLSLYWLWFHTQALWFICQINLGLPDLCFEIRNMLGSIFFLHSNWVSHWRQLSAISGKCKYCICNYSFSVTQKVVPPVLWALMQLLYCIAPTTIKLY